MAERRTRVFGRVLLAACIPLLAVGLAACNYSFRGGSFPEHVRTVAILPFENETTRLELTQEVYDAMLRNLPGALGVTSAAEENADAVVTGMITGYDVRTPNYRPGEGGERVDVLQREVVLTLEVQIVDRVENVILYEDSGLRGEGQYLEASQTETDGMQEALEILVQRIVDGAQSNW